MRDIKKTKYPFISYFSGDFYTWVKSDFNFKSLFEKYGDTVKIVDEYRYERLMGKLTPEQLQDILPTQITDGLGFGDKAIEVFTDRYEDRITMGNEEEDSVTIEDIVAFDNAIEKEFSNNGVVRFNFEDDRNFREVVRKTKVMMESAGDFIAFEPAFEYKGWRTRVDVLIRENGVLKLYEAKASTKYKKEHQLDLFYQWKLINNLGYNLDSKELRLALVNNEYTIDNEYVSPIILWFGTVDPRQWDDMTPRKRANARTFEELMSELDEVIDYDFVLERAAKVQEMNLEDVLLQSYESANSDSFGIASMFMGQNISEWGGDRYQALLLDILGTNFDGSLWEVKWLPVKKKIQYWMDGLRKATELPVQDLVSKSAYYESIDSHIREGRFISDGTRMLQQVIYDEQGKEVIREEFIKNHLNLYKGPIYMYDFETFTQAIPTLHGQRPYEQIAFQYSVHIIHDPDNFDPKDESTWTHKEFLLEDLSQVGEELFTNLANDMFAKGEGTWVSWNKSFEQMVIRNELKRGNLPQDVYEKLDRVLNETIDMMDIAKHKWYYNPEWKGSYSIKFATKSFSPLDYKKDLVNVQNGLLASNMAKRWVSDVEGRDTFWKELRKDMLRYCEYDTLSMVYIYDGIRKLVK